MIENVKLRCPGDWNCSAFITDDLDPPTSVRLNALVDEHNAGVHARVNDLEGKQTRGSDLTRDHEVKTDDGWDRIEMLNGYCWRLKESGLAIPRDLVVIARKAPKPDPIQERVEKVKRIIDDEFQAVRDPVSQAVTADRIAQRIANGEAD